VKFRARIIGDIAKDVKAFNRRLARSTKNAAVKAGTGLKNEYRAQVRAAGLGQKVANAWRSAAYPKNGDSVNSAASIWTNAPHIIAAHDRGEVIRSKHGFWLPIPTEFAPKRGIGGKRISPSTFPEHRFGPLRFIYRGRSQAALLVVDKVRVSYRRKTGERRGFRKAGKRAVAKGDGLTVVMFVLVPQVSIRRDLDVEGPVARWGREFVKEIDAGMAKAG
jgi:hypothetical protein